MKFAAIRSAFAEALLGSSLGIDLLWEGDDEDTVGSEAHALCSYLPATADPVTTSPVGLDLHEGIFQVLLKYPTGEGIGNALEKADEIALLFQAGAQLSYDAQVVKVRGVSIAPPLTDGGWLRVPVSINYSAFVRRSL